MALAAPKTVHGHGGGGPGAFIEPSAVAFGAAFEE